jgi:hypothetical protein
VAAAEAVQKTSVRAVPVAALREELEHMIADCQSRIQDRADEAVWQRERFEARQECKQWEIQRIVEASALCVRSSSAPVNNNSIALLDRASAARG